MCSSVPSVTRVIKARSRFSRYWYFSSTSLSTIWLYAPFSVTSMRMASTISLSFIPLVIPSSSSYDDETQELQDHRRRACHIGERSGSEHLLHISHFIRIEHPGRLQDLH